MNILINHGKFITKDFEHLMIAKIPEYYEPQRSPQPWNVMENPVLLHPRWTICIGA